MSEEANLDLKSSLVSYNDLNKLTQMSKVPDQVISFDTEFFSFGDEISLISLGMVTDRGDALYIVPPDIDNTIRKIQDIVHGKSVLNQSTPIYRQYLSNAKWLTENVVPNIYNPHTPIIPSSNKEFQEIVTLFCGTSPQFWAYISSYDWVVLRQMWGSIVDGPRHWPYSVNDLAVILGILNLKSKDFPQDTPDVLPNHNALADAYWGYKVRKTFLEWNDDGSKDIAFRTLLNFKIR